MTVIGLRLRARGRLRLGFGYEEEGEWDIVTTSEAADRPIQLRRRLRRRLAGGDFGLGIIKLDK